MDGLSCLGGGINAGMITMSLFKVHRKVYLYFINGLITNTLDNGKTSFCFSFLGVI